MARLILGVMKIYLCNQHAKGRKHPMASFHPQDELDARETLPNFKETEYGDWDKITRQLQASTWQR